MSERLDILPTKGRGVVTNPTGRFERETRELTDDGWGNRGVFSDINDGRRGHDEDVEDMPPLDRLPAAAIKTTLAIDTSKTVIARNSSPDIGFDRSINPYRGCEHGCVYCYARPTHAYLGLSPGLDFETQLFMKPDAPEQLEKELSRKGYKPATIALGANTDPYQPVERETCLTRRLLKVLAKARHPVGIVTKSALITRDIDILAPMADQELVVACISVTTLDPSLAARLEPRASTPQRRLKAIRQLHDAGIPVAILTSPIIPGLNDHEMEAILEAGRDAGAKAANFNLIRLPLEIKDLFREWLAVHTPDRAGRVLSLIKQCRRGKLNDSGFGDRMRGSGPIADMIGRRFERARQRLGLDRRSWPLRTDLFRAPNAVDQGDLFG